MNKRGYERDLKRDLFAAQRGSSGQGCDLVESARKLRHGFDKVGSFCPALPHRSAAFFDQSDFGAMTRQSGWFSVISANWSSSVAAMRA